MKDLAGKLMRVAVTLGLCAGVTAGAATLVRYDFEGEVLTPTESHGRVTASDLSYIGNGTTGFPEGQGGAGDCISATAWPPNGGGAVDVYYAFDVTIEDGYKVDLSTLRFAQSRSGTGPTNWVARYSYDNVLFRPLRSGTLPADDTWYDTSTHVTNLTGTVYFKLYASESSGGAGVYRVDNIEVTGNIAMDDGRRIIRHQNFEDDLVDDWSVTTNAGIGTIAVTDVRHHVGQYSQRLTGSADGSADPYIDLANVSLTGIEEPRLWMGYAADNPDSEDDLYVLLSYDNGSTWSWTNKLVDGYGSQDVDFGETNPTNPATAGSNPFHYLIPADKSQVKVRVQFDEKSGANNESDHYYVDYIRLIGRPTPAANEAPTVELYGSAFEIQSDQTKVAAHVVDGYPDPEVTVYWGVDDGGEDSGAWGFASSLGTREIGYASASIGGLEPGQTYYYRFHAGNSEGSDWSDTAGSFTAKTASIDAVRRMYLDSFAVSTHMPLNIDEDGDGVSDAWENDYLGGTGETAAGNKDGDAMTNEEEFWAGTDPDDANSVLRILGVDISDAASDDVTIRWSGGDHQGPTDFMTAGDSGVRTFRVRAASGDAANAKAAVASRAPTGTGVNSWIDTNAVGSLSSRFYEISVVHGDGAYTNTEEWAVIPQERPESSERFICVPVHYRLAASNNLNSVLGDHLARGMHAGDAEGNSDSVRILNGSGTWDVYYLSSAHGWTTDFSSTANVEIAPGQPMWVVRRNGAVTRSNAVYAGLTFDNSMMTDRTFTNGEWTAFGWPLPSARAHSSGGGTDQLEFYSQGTGGVSYDRSATNSGDQIWVPHGDGWRFYMLLDDHDGSGDAYSGRWWGDGTGDGGLADFSLEPGKAYYYFHTTNWSSGDFTWKPQNP